MDANQNHEEEEDASTPLQKNGLPDGGPESLDADKERLEDEADDANFRKVCGVGPFHPKAIQCMASIGWFTGVFSVSGLVTSTLSVYINSQITALERQFGFSSSVSGILLSCNDFGYLLTTLFMSYMARRTHIPRILALATTFYGVAGLLCCLPHFVSSHELSVPPPLANTSLARGPSLAKAGDLCQVDSITRYDVTGNGSLRINDACAGGSGRPGLSQSDFSRNFAVIIIGLGMILQGMGKSPRFPFIVTYVDDNVDKTKTSWYLGIMSSSGIFGPVVAYLLGGTFSKIYVTLEATDMSPRDPRWVGAWWLGYLVFGLLGLASGVPLVLFPRRLRPPTRSVRQATQELKAQGKAGVGGQLKGLLQALLRLLANPIFLMLTLGGCCNLFSVAGMLAFMPKYLETQFYLPAWKANMLLGGVTVLSASVGTVIGGAIITRLKLRPITCLKMYVLQIFLSWSVSTLQLLFSCPNPVILTASASNSSCMADCHCGDATFFPVCADDGQNYFSPCHAGCQVFGKMGYTNCTCSGEAGLGQGAKPGLCDPGCNAYIVYIVVTFFSGILGSMSIMPSFITTIRCVKEIDKPLAVGLAAFCGTLLGWFPGPVVYGRLVDTVCTIWSEKCGRSGACALYDLDNFRFRFHGLFLGIRGLTFILGGCALIIALRKEDPFFEKPVPSMELTVEKKKLTNGNNMSVAPENEKETKVGVE